MTQSFNGLCRSVKNCITNTFAATTLDIYNQCETKLAETISKKKAEIAEEKAKQKEGAD